MFSLKVNKVGKVGVRADTCIMLFFHFIFHQNHIHSTNELEILLLIYKCNLDKYNYICSMVSLYLFRKGMFLFIFIVFTCFLLQNQLNVGIPASFDYNTGSPI